MTRRVAWWAIALLSVAPFPIACKIVAWACWVPNLIVAEWFVRVSSASPLQF
jgi:hypothetical protein